jgi:hypothetical protein
MQDGFLGESPLGLLCMGGVGLFSRRSSFPPLSHTEPVHDFRDRAIDSCASGAVW